MPADPAADAVVHQGLILPAHHLRFCTADFQDDGFYLASAKREADRLIERCGLAPHSALLDIGCGQGRLAIGLLARSRELWPEANHGAAGIKRYEGVDVSAGAIDWCRRNLAPLHPSFRFTHLDARNARYNPGGFAPPAAAPLPLDDESFDVINLYSVFTHLLAADVEFYLREMARLLAPRGRAFCTAYIEPGVADVAENPEGYRGPSSGPLHRVRYSTEFFTRLVAAAGLRIDRLDHAAEFDGQSGVYLSRVITAPPTPGEGGGRKLEIGPGTSRIAGFETLNIVPGANVDHIGDAAKALPFPDGTFALIYASHILEHIPWYQTVDALREWRRVLAPGGALEVWVPDGLKICRTFVEAETGGEDRTINDGWYRFNPQRDPCIWAAGRIFTYGDGDGNPSSPNWHRALFSPRHLENCLHAAGFGDIQRLPRAHVRGDDHGWINLGMRGIKPEARE